MSQKITAKNLSYNQSLPPFLAALHAQTSSSTGPDPLLASRRRPAAARSGSAEEEDLPLVVDDRGDVVDAKVGKDGSVSYEEGLKRGKEGSKEEGEGSKGEGDVSGKVSSLGPGRKRRAGKVIGGDEDEGSVKDTLGREKGGNESGAKWKSGEESEKPKGGLKGKKKAKKIKLSFDDGE